MPSPVPAPTSDATATRRGLMGITAQSFSGIKTFLDAIRLAFKTTATLPVGGAELEGQVLYNTTTKRAMVHDGTSWVPVVMAVDGESTISLEEHLASLSAHDSSAITYADTNVESKLESLQEQTDVLDTEKVRRNTVSDTWESATITTADGWSGTVSCLVGDDKKVLVQGTATRANSSWLNGIPFQLPVSARPARPQPKVIPGYVGSTFTTVIINIQTTGHIQIMNEPPSGWTDPVLMLSGVEFSLV